MHFLILLTLFLGTGFGHGESSPIFTCDFEDGTMCEMQNSDGSINFTVATGQTLVHMALGPAFDHTLGTTLGHFLYWYHSSEIVRVRADGQVFTTFSLQPNLCLKFAYYINSISTPDNLTALDVTLSGCSEGLISSVKVIESNGWQTIQTKLPDDSCTAILYFYVSSNATEAVSVAVDDISIDICAMTSPSPTTGDTTPTMITSSTTGTAPTEISSSPTMTTPSMPTTTSLGSISRYSFLIFIICIFFLTNQFY
jgi:hypothetical protein